MTGLVSDLHAKMSFIYDATANAWRVAIKCWIIRLLRFQTMHMVLVQ